jgi:hypothetical protein
MASPYKWSSNTDFSAVRVFNALCTTYAGGMSSQNSGAANRAALQAAVSAAIGTIGPGGLVLIPAGTYQISGTVTISNQGNDAPLIISGTCGGTQLVQQSAGDTFVVTSLGSSSKGVRFRDLLISYSSGGGGFLTGIAVRVDGCENVSCERVYFYNCPQSAVFDEQSLACGLINCTIYYQSGANNQTMITLLGPEQYVRDCVIKQTNQVSTIAPTGCIGITISDAANDIYVNNTHVLDFTIGIQILSSAMAAARPILSNVVCQSWQTSLLIKPSTQVYQAFFRDCIFLLSQFSDQTASPGILIASNGPAVTDLCFENCMCFGWGGSGIEITTGSNIQINGGRYGSCALGDSTRGGITVAGNVTGLTIDGADCSGSVPGYGRQPNGISIIGPLTDGYIHNCNMKGNGNAALHVSGTVSNLEVTACAGYNDAGTVVSTIPPISGATFKNSSFGYYGPIAFYTPGAAVQSIYIDGVNTHLTAGAFTLAPGETAVINYQAPELFLLMIGE